MEREPLLIRGAIVAAVVACIQVAVAFGVDMTAEQVAVLATAVNVVGTAVVVVWSRGKITPVSDPRDNSGQALTTDD